MQVSEAGEHGAMQRHDRRPVHEHAVSAAAAATLEDKKRNALRTMAYSTSLGLTAWLDKSTIYALGPLHPRQGSANVDRYRSRDAWNAVHNEGRMTMRVQMDFTAFASATTTRC